MPLGNEKHPSADPDVPILRIHFHVVFGEMLFNEVSFEHRENVNCLFVVGSEYFFKIQREGFALCFSHLSF